ncbi:hypothetical protein NDU88_005665 [Pleurodeles waltl]|uniref:Uncharacterized protein n=1 Tax=Pleurodeles waltl TaxID=8319 RepID=A0AAV7X1W5_PLEWA|nr:hypothetical protein NDU88_005665 [Pleurodeles waltl]
MVPGGYQVAACGMRRLRRRREPESAALPVGGRLSAKVRGGGVPLLLLLIPTPPNARSCAGGPDHTVQNAVATPILPRRLPLVGGPLTLGRGRARRRRPPVTPRPMVLRALCPAGEICCFLGLRFSQFWEAAGRLPQARVAPAVAEVWLGARSFVLRRPFSSVAKPRLPPLFIFNISNSNRETFTK